MQIFVGGPAADFPIFSVSLSLARRGWEEGMYGGGRESHPKQVAWRPWRSNTWFESWQMSRSLLGNQEGRGDSKKGKNWAKAQNEFGELQVIQEGRSICRKGRSQTRN